MNLKEAVDTEKTTITIFCKYCEYELESKVERVRALRNDDNTCKHCHTWVDKLNKIIK